jgi:hypothetical protein
MRNLIAACLALTAFARAEAQATLPKLRLVEDLRIDGAALDISGIGDMVLRPGGGVVIVEPQDFRLRFFDGAGKEIAKFGRRGEGPGEFSMGNMISPIQAPVQLGLIGDSVWAYNARRFVLLSPDGRLTRTVPQPEKLPGGGGLGGARPEAGPNRVVIDFRPIALVRGAYALGSTRWGRVTPERRTEDPEAGYAVASEAGEITRVVAIIPPDNGSFVRVTTDAAGSGMSMAVPFVEQMYRVNAKDGSRVGVGVTTLASDKQAVLRIVVVGVSGDTIVARNLAFTPEPITKQMADSAVTAQMRSHRPNPASKTPPRTPPAVADELESKLRAAMPKWRSVYRNIAFGADNSIWVSMATTTGGRQYLLLDERGNQVATLTVPTGFGFAPGLSTRSLAWGVVSDADDLPSIVRYRVVPLADQ